MKLISKSDIRYVGILQNVDTQSSSLVLGQVQSFGTEGRRGGHIQDEIPPSPSIFQYIVFRGADVKDLQVFEAPPMPTTSDSMSHFVPFAPPVPLPYSYNNYPMPAISPPYGPPMTYPYPSADAYFPPPLPLNTVALTTQKPQVPDDVDPETTISSETLVPDSYTETPPPRFISDGNKHLMISKPDTKDSPIPLSRMIPDTSADASNTTEIDGLSTLRSPPNEMEPPGKTMTSTIDDTTHRLSSDLHANKGSLRSKSKAKSTKATPPTTLQDFDFASSNAKFNKANEETSVGLTGDAFYDKEKSFFDNISCDAKSDPIGRSRGGHRRNHHLDEKQLNLETFGQASVRQGGRKQGRRRNNHRKKRGSDRLDLDTLY
ncbi:hypothetical protein [Absidia glauca]|uniref:DFDF domain-containing protein n=1 Tax=Absidia glauca TaxID=4829 RepID=A0A163L186_ABSGL|nr:hypothetical protein [Absidia glauca]